MMRTKGYTLLILILLAVIAAFSSCSPQARLNRLLKNHPELIKKDTLFVFDTIKIRADRKDTLFLQSATHDTVILEKGRLLMKYFYSKDTVFLQGECRDSVIIKEIPVYINDIKPGKNKKNELNPWFVVGILGLFIVLMILIKR